MMRIPNLMGGPQNMSNMLPNANQARRLNRNINNAYRVGGVGALIRLRRAQRQGGMGGGLMTGNAMRRQNNNANNNLAGGNARGVSSLPFLAKLYLANQLAVKEDQEGKLEAAAAAAVIAVAEE
jgi:hypothetical protein